MLKSMVLASGLAVAAVVGVQAIDSEAADAPAAASTPRARWANSPLGKLITGRIGRAMVLRSELDVTDEQRQQVRSILLSHKKDIAGALEPVVQQRRKLRAAVLAEQPDEKEIRAAADSLGKSVGDAAVTMSRVAGELRKVLDDEQLKKIQQFRGDNATAVDSFFAKALDK